MKIIFIVASLLVLSTAPLSAQAFLTPRWQEPKLSAEELRERAAQRQAFERFQADSPECKRMHIGCPEGSFTREQAR